MGGNIINTENSSIHVMTGSGDTPLNIWYNHQRNLSRQEILDKIVILCIYSRPVGQNQWEPHIQVINN